MAFDDHDGDECEAMFVCLTYTNEPAPKERKRNQERAIATSVVQKSFENERRDDGVDETDGKEGEKKRGRRTLKDDMLFRRFCDCLFYRGMTSSGIWLLYMEEGSPRCLTNTSP